MTKYLTMGVVGKSLKEDEKRVAIHPEHIERIPKELRELITFEKGYGLRFGMDDDTLAKLTSGRVAAKEEILKGFDCVLMPKPLVADLNQIQDGTIVWGWPHCVQQKEMTQISISCRHRPVNPLAACRTINELAANSSVWLRFQLLFDQ